MTVTFGVRSIISKLGVGRSVVLKEHGSLERGRPVELIRPALATDIEELKRQANRRQLRTPSFAVPRSN